MFSYDNMIVNNIPSGVSFEIVPLDLRHSCNTRAIVIAPVQSDRVGGGCCNTCPLD